MFSDPETVPLPKKAISLRMPPKTVAAIDRRAADSGVDRTRYILRLVDQDLAQRLRKSKRRFLAFICWDGSVPKAALMRMFALR